MLFIYLSGFGTADYVFFAFEAVIIVIMLLAYIFRRAGTIDGKISVSNATLTINKVHYIKQVVKWCIETLSEENRKIKFPQVEVNYYKSKKFAGVYNSASKTICIYVNSNSNLLELTDTIIHEYKHHLDMPNQSQQKLYNKYTEDYGYENNPFEIAAREFALKHRLDCMKDMCKIGFIR